MEPPVVKMTTAQVDFLPLDRDRMWDVVEGETSTNPNAECAVINCSNTMRTHPQIKYYLFPKEPGEVVIWSCLLGRIHVDNSPWAPPPGACVCQKHFLGERRLKIVESGQYFPSIFPAIQPGDTLPLNNKRARNARQEGYYIHRTEKNAQRRTSILIQKADMPEPDPDLDGLTWDELEEIMYESIYKPAVMKMHELAAEMKSDLDQKLTKMLEISHKLDSIRCDLDLQRQRSEVESRDILIQTAYTHVGSLQSDCDDISVNAACQAVSNLNPQGAESHVQPRIQRKLVFDVRMPSIVKDTRFTKLTPLKINQTVFVLEGRKTDAWGKGVVTKSVDYDHDSVMIRVQNAVKEKAFSLGQVAYSNPHNVQLQLGSRIVSQYVPDKQFYAGVVIEYPKWQNRHRYLILFEDGYWQYSEPSNMFLICKQTSMPWSHVNQPIVPFLKKHFSTTEHALLRASVGQIVQAEREKQFFAAKVMAVDGNLLKLAFRHYGDTFATEWIYAGSHRLRLVFEHLSQTNRSKHKIARRKTGKKGQPYLEFADDTLDVIELSDNEDDEEAGGDDEIVEATVSPDGVPRKNTARKSTTAKPYETEPGTPRALKGVAKIDLGLQGVVERVKVQSIRSQIPFVVHNCSRNCIHSNDDPLKFTSISPYVMPYFVGWTRHEVKVRKKVIVCYRTPCGRTMRSHRDVMDYLIMTESKLTVDQFCFEPGFDPFAVFKATPVNIFKEDITNGKEFYPISLVNAVDDKDEGSVPYWPERRPTEAVKKVMELDEQFLPCCSCEDDCLDRAMCECQRQTVNMSDAQGELNRYAGYTFRSLNEPLVTGVFECNSRCACSKRCVNRVAQNGIQLRLQLFKTERKGYGVRTLHDIPRGRFICTYAGTILTDIEADESGQDTYFAELDYIDNVVKHKEGYESQIEEDIDDIDDEDELGLEPASGSAPASSADASTKKKLDADQLRQIYYGKEETYVMDALTGGNIGRYFNHCCEPNMFVQNVFVDTHDLRFPWVAFFAERNINAGEELTWDYMYEVDSVPGRCLRCYCGMPNCRKRLL